MNALADESAAVKVRGLVKRFGDFVAVGGVDFSVSAGEIFAFLGPNGAGKSTTIKMLCTLSRPTQGSAVVAGYDVSRQAREVRRRIGLVFQDQTLDEQLTADENLRFHAELYGVPKHLVAERTRRLLDMVGLAGRGRDVVEHFSGGMARRLEIGRALMHSPRVLFLDEPTVGLDPQTRARIWADIRRLRDEERVTVFLTTHYMDEAEYADRIAIIDAGQIVACDTPEALKATVRLDSVLMSTADDEAAAKALAASGIPHSIDADGVRASVRNGETAVPVLLDLIGVPVSLVRVERPTLDDVFMHFTGHQIRADDGNANARLSERVRSYRARK